MSKGKGFAGHIKRHNFKRGPKTHGSDHHREPGSIGPGTTPGRVYKGMRMAGHMGDERVTVKKVRIVRTDPERNLLLVNGSLPGFAQRADPREEGLTMPQTTLYDRTGASIGSVELSDQLFDAPVNAAVLHQVVTAQLAGRHLGHARHQDPRRGPRRRPQAVPPEGDRPAPARATAPHRTSGAAGSCSARTRARMPSACRAR